MKEKGDTPTAAEVVHSASSVSLNDGSTPKTEHKMNLLERFGTLTRIKKKTPSLSIESKEDILAEKVAQLTKDLEESRMECEGYKAAHLASEKERNELHTNIKYEAKLKAAAIKKLEAKMQYEIKCKTEAINNLKKMEAKIEEKSKREKNIHVRFTEISKLTTTERVYTEPTEFAGATWKVFVHKIHDDSIVVYLEGGKEIAYEWWCPVIAEFHIISEKTDEIGHLRRVELNHGPRWEVCLAQISEKDLFDEDKGYVMDDSIEVNVVIRFPTN